MNLTVGAVVITFNVRNRERRDHRTCIMASSAKAAVEREAGEAREVMAQFRQQVADIRAQLAEAREEVESGARPTSGGVSYLELKLQLLLSYCTHLSVRAAAPCPSERAAVCAHMCAGVRCLSCAAVAL